MPRPETVDQALAEISKSAANYQHFFEILNHPSWIRPLAARGRFRNPPQKVAVEGGVIFPPWPESRYLARMAQIPSAQQEVLAIVQALPETDNVNVNSDLLDIARALPAHDAARLVTKARTWIQTPYHSLVKYHIGDLIVHLAEGGEANAAFQLAGDAFALLSPPEESGDVLSPEPDAWLDDWHYAEAIKKAVPVLARVDGARTLALLCDVLVQALEQSRSQDEQRHIDYSYIWHEAIEEDEHPARLRSSLISAVRNTATQFVAQAPENLPRASDVLHRYDWPVFKRLEIDLLRRFPEIGMEQIVALLPQVMDVEPPTQHEAALLIRTVFGRLPAPVQEAVLRHFDAGPERDGVIAWLGDQATPENIAGLETYWRARRFALIEDQLSGEWAAKARDAITRAGGVRALDEVNRGATWVGPSSPKTADDLAQLGPEAVLAFLRDWQPIPGPMEATPEGLGRVLQEVIAKDPGPYAKRSMEFRGTDPTFVRFLFNGLEAAQKEHRAFDWQPVLDLAGWVVAQPREIPGRHKTLMEADPDWSWTRGAIATLLEAGTSDQTQGIPIAQRQTVWGVLGPLTNDPEPTMEYEAKYGGSNMEPSTLAINTVRGKAFNALIDYGLWVRRDLDKQEPKPAMTLDVMPEVREVLDEHLVLDREPTLTIRSVYGRYFPFLFLLDPAWAAGAVGRVFPAEPEPSEYWLAAWESYVTFCTAYKDLLPILRAEYARAIRLKRVGEEPKGRRAWREFVAHHLVAFYWMGAIEIDDPLLVDFFDRSPDDVRADALGYIGRSLEQNKAVPQNILGRLRGLWLWRLGLAQQAPDKAPFRQELAQYGWWFCSGKFEDKWNLEQLLAVLDTTGIVEPDFKVAETLEALAGKFPLLCVQCVARIAQADTKGWTTLASRDQIIAVLKVALASDNLDAKSAADRLIQYLVARGNFEYRKLLP